MRKRRSLNGYVSDRSAIWFAANPSPPYACMQTISGISTVRDCRSSIVAPSFAAETYFWAMGTLQKVRAAMLFSPYSRLSMLHLALSR